MKATIIALDVGANVIITERLRLHGYDSFRWYETVPVMPLKEKWSDVVVMVHQEFNQPYLKNFQMLPTNRRVAIHTGRPTEEELKKLEVPFLLYPRGNLKYLSFPSHLVSG